MEMNEQNFNLLVDQIRNVTQENDTLKVIAQQEQASFRQQNAALRDELVKTQYIVEAMNKNNGSKQHVQTTNLLKSKEPASFTNKTNYSVWAEGIKADLVPVLPELKHFSNLPIHGVP